MRDFRTLVCKEEVLSPECLLTGPMAIVVDVGDLLGHHIQLAVTGNGHAGIIDVLNLTMHRWQGDGIQQLLGFASAICCHRNICRQGHPVTLC